LCEIYQLAIVLDKKLLFFKYSIQYFSNLAANKMKLTFIAILISTLLFALSSSQYYHGFYSGVYPGSRVFTSWHSAPIPYWRRPAAVVVVNPYVPPVYPVYQPYFY
jgi:hypothetical protein